MKAPMADPQLQSAGLRRPVPKEEVTGTAYCGLSVQDTFTKIYDQNSWGKGSGLGSVPQHIQKWIDFLHDFIVREQIRSVADLGCGDWQFSPQIYDRLPCIQYVGYDCVASVIAANKEKHPGYVFEVMEFSKSAAELQDAELYILKDVLQHWSNKRVVSFLLDLLQMKAQRGLRWILMCNDWATPGIFGAADIIEGGWRPLSTEHPPLKVFQPQVLLRFQVPGAIKEVCAIQIPTTLSGSRTAASPAACIGTRCAATIDRGASFRTSNGAGAQACARNGGFGFTCQASKRTHFNRSELRWASRQHLTS